MNSQPRDSERPSDLDPHTYWNSFYQGADRAVPTSPTAFAQWATDFIPDGDSVWEFGFGNARDALWFASLGRPVRGFDFAESAVDRATSIAQRNGLNAAFSRLDLSDAVQIRALMEESMGTARGHIYGRFLIHSLTDEARANLFDVAQKLLVGGGNILLEFRTNRDAEASHVFGDDHFRTYLDPDLVVAELTNRGANLNEYEQGYGLAVYKTEDPHIARIVAAW